MRMEKTDNNKYLGKPCPLSKQETRAFGCLWNPMAEATKESRGSSQQKGGTEREPESCTPVLKVHFSDLFISALRLLCPLFPMGQVTSLCGPHRSWGGGVVTMVTAPPAQLLLHPIA